MIARAPFRFRPAHLHAPIRPTFNSFISPTYARFTRNSFVSPTCAKTRGVYPLKNVGAPTFSLNCLRTLSFFGACLSPVSPALSALFPKKQGVYPLYQPLFTGRRPLSPFTAHSQSCYRAFTHPSLCLVTMDPSQGTNSYTMPTVNTRPTVHFYRCDLPGEIRS
jgi:hypothetical protein